MMELKDTIQMMVSEDYKERYRAEYWQTKIRFDKLCRMIDQYKEGTLLFVPMCPIEILRLQLDSMSWYLTHLLGRAQIEKICLDEPGGAEDIGKEICEECRIRYSGEEGLASL